MERAPKVDRTWFLAAIVLLVAPAAAIALGLALATACPLYSEWLKGYCYYADEDLPGGWTSIVACVFFLDLVAVGVFLVSAYRARR